ncbi:MAG: hypothetical protein LUH15_11965 [Tannerellaceae bacterium]|nr:hypothetical protein [Tannerellaceae bacterium]
MCEIEVKNIIEYQKELNHISILIITNSEIEKISSFSDKYNLSSIANLYILIDEELNQFEKYDINSLPTSFIYNKELNLKIKHKGIINIQKILNLID